ncbi:MAG: flagellin [Rubricella sp.]
MSSILTNNSSMIALQTLNTINRDLQGVQNQISTGKAVGSAKDNSAVWAISSVMRSDVEGFKAISESLSLGSSTVAVGRQAAETVTDLLTEIKGKIVAAQEENVDRAKIQTDINSMSEQITSVVSTAQFNGLNLLQGRDAVEVLSSLDRNSDGTVTDRSIAVQRQDLTTTAGAFGAGNDITTNATLSDTTLSAAGNTATLNLSGTPADGNDVTLNIAGTDVTYTVQSGDDAAAVADGLRAAITAAGIEGITSGGTGAALEITSTRAFEAVDLTYTEGTSAVTSDATTATIAQRAETVSLPGSTTIAEGDSYRVSIDGTDFEYVARAGDTAGDVLAGLRSEITAATLTDITTSLTIDETTGDATLSIDNAGSDVNIGIQANEGGVIGGGLEALASIDVTTNDGADAALAAIEGLIQTAIDSAAEFGSVERQIEIQNDFVGKLSDALKSGIGALVDANMEEASARLQALQVQQQLGIQALSIANQAPNNILALFR